MSRLARGLRSALFPETASGLRRRDRGLLCLAVLLMALLVARAARKQAGVLVNNQEFGQRFLDGDDPYVERATGLREHGPYPPSYVLVCAPLALLPTSLARVVWALLQCAALAWMYLLSRRRLADTWPRAAPHAPLVFAAAVLLVSRFLLRDMAAGGGNLIYATLALTALEASARSRPVAAGLALAVGWIAKPNLILFGLFYALRGRWRTLAWGALFAAVLFVSPAVRLGASRYSDLSARWARDVVTYAALEDPHDPERVPAGLPLSVGAMNQSLREASLRLLRPSREERVPDANPWTLSPRAAAWTARLASLAALLLVAWVTLRAPPGRSTWLVAQAFFVLSLLLSPITWKAHCVALLPVFVALFAEASSAPRARGLVLFLLVYYLLCDLANEELLGKGTKTLLQAWSVVTWCNVLLLFAVLARAWGAADFRRAARPR